MPMVSRFSEPVSPSGGLQAQGLVNLLGAPPIDPLTLVLREAAQNAWDARCQEGSGAIAPTMLVRVRMLVGAEADALRELLLSGLDAAGEPAELDLLSTKLRNHSEIPVLEICDFGTEGLSGSVDPVRESSRFVKFFFDIGASHFDGSTGGTYGFGRSSLYLIGEPRTIVVDSLPAAAGGERRLMACRLGDSYTASAGVAIGKRHTGRHFWGARDPARASVLPLTGDTASVLAQRLGFPERSRGGSGTSIMIPWPLLDLDSAPHLIPQILYHNLWPKLVPVDGKVPMRLEVDVSGRRQLLDIERAHPIYQSFAMALRKARIRRPPAKPIGPERPRVVAGHVAVEQVGGLVFDDAPDEARDPLRPFREGVRHVALMRASELVVRYQRIDLDSPAAPWVGVVLAETSQQVAAAFAASEPPAHDDWIPGKLTGTSATIVRTTLRKLQATVQDLLGIRPPTVPQGAASASLAAAADHFAENFLAGDGTGAGPLPGNGGGGGGKASPGVSAPEFLGLQIDGERTIARYGVTWSGGVGAMLLADAEVAIEGGVLQEKLAGLDPPEVTEWISPAGESFAGPRCRTTGAGRYEVRVAYGGMYAVSLAVAQEAAA